MNRLEFFFPTRFARGGICAVLCFRLLAHFTHSHRAAYSLDKTRRNRRVWVRATPSGCNHKNSVLQYMRFGSSGTIGLNAHPNHNVSVRVAKNMGK